MISPRLFSGVKILAFPCNQFASDAPEKDGKEIMEHLKESNADIGDIFSKIDVNGDNAEPLYEYLKEELGGFIDDSIKWNFTKFVVNKEGKPVERFAPLADIASVEKKITELLA